MPQFVNLVNKGNSPFDFHHQNKKKIIQPGGNAIVPWDIATTLFGDPFVLDDGKKNDRTRTYKHVLGLFGYQNGMMTQEEWEFIRPKIEVYDLETQERVYMLLEDPEGLHSLPQEKPTEDSSAIAFLQRQLSQTQAQLATLLEMAQQGALGQAVGQVATPSEDAPAQGTPEAIEVQPGEFKQADDGTFTLSIPAQQDTVREDTPSTPNLPPRKK